MAQDAIGVRGMKALTISQPWAEEIASGRKWVENRAWPPPAYPIDLAIHAGTGTHYLTRAEVRAQGLPTGAVVAVCRLVAAVNIHTRYGYDGLAAAGIDRADFNLHEHTEGPWCWVLKDIRRLPEPVPAKGRLGLWDWDPPT